MFPRVALFLTLLVAPMAAAAPERTLTFKPSFAGAVPMELVLPDGGRGWTFTEQEDLWQLTGPMGLPPVIVVGAFMYIQPALDRISLDVGAQEIMDAMDIVDWGEAGLVLERDTHPTLGPLLRGHTTGTLTLEGHGVDMQAILFEIPAGVGVMWGTALRGRGGLRRRMDEVLAAVRLTVPRRTHAELTPHPFEGVEGWTIEIPEGLRPLTLQERRLTGLGAAAAAQFIDPAGQGDAPYIACVVNSQAEPIVLPVDPVRGPQLADLFRAHVRAVVTGGVLQVREGTTVRRTRFEGHGAAMRLDAGAPEELRVVQLGDRPGWLWSGRGTTGSRAVSVKVVGMAWDDKVLECVAVVGIGDGGPLIYLEPALLSVRVVDAAAHPMNWTPVARWARAWPFASPAPNPALPIALGSTLVLAATMALALRR